MTAGRTDGSTAEGGWFSPALVGRRDEIEALAAAADDPPKLVLIEGEMGIGKSRLIEEFRAHPRAQGTRLLVGRSHELGEPAPLGPVLEALSGLERLPSGTSALAGSLHPYLPELAASLPAPLHPLPDPTAERHRLLRSIHEVLSSVPHGVLVLEDAHWLDASSQELLERLRASWPDGLSLVLTFRGEDLPSTSIVRALLSRGVRGVDTRHLTLAPLAPEEVRAFVGSALGRSDVSDEFADYLHRQTAGIPFALEEMLLLLQDRSDLVRRSGRWVRRKLEELEAPRGVLESIRARLARLDARARQIVQAAAVLHPAASEKLLRRVTDVEEPAFGEGLANAVRGALLWEVRDGEYGFRHALAREAVYRAIGGAERRRLHSRAGTALGEMDEGSPEQLARHARSAGDLEGWRRHAEAAADRASAAGDHFGAVQLLRDLPDGANLRGEDRVQVLLKLAHAATIGLVHRESIPIVLSAIGETSLPAAARGRLRYQLARLLHQAGDASGAYREWRKALKELPGGAVERALLLSNLASPCVVEHTVDEHLGRLDEALAGLHTLTQPGDRAFCLVDRAVTLTYLGDPAAGSVVEDLPWGAPDPAVRNQLLRGAFNLATALIPLGHDERAAAFVREGERLGGASHGLRFARFTDIFHLLLDWRAGRWSELRERAIEIEGDREELHAAAIAIDLVMGSVLLARGDVRAGRERLTGFVEAALRAGWIAGAASASAQLAAVETVSGRPGAGRERASRVLSILSEKGMWVWGAELVPEVVRALLDLGRRSEADALADRFARGTTGADAPASEAARLTCEALLGAETDPRGAARAHGAAAETWRRIGRPYEVARSLEAAARSIISVDREEGVRSARLAAERFGEPGAAWDRARVRRLLRAHGAAPPQRRGRRGYGLALSPREREVAALLERGWSNREIAESMFISVKAVEKHVSSILRKLGVSSRSEVGGALSVAGQK